MTESFLKKILDRRLESCETQRRQTDMKWLMANVPARKRLSLSAALKDPGLSLIAEIKTASPSKGTIKKSVRIKSLVEKYEKAGASAISVLTEPEFFGGDWRRIKRAKTFSNLPVLCKDFIVKDFQIKMAWAQGADAILLIAAAFPGSELDDVIEGIHALDMETLTEAHTREELERVLASETDVIGINNRNLDTLDVDTGIGLELLKGLDDKRPVVVESGIFNRHEVVEFEQSGADAILVGTALMESDNIAAKVKELLGN